MATLLSICQDAASELGLRQPSTIVGSTDLTAQILFRLSNQAGIHLMRYHDWQALTVQNSFTTVATVTQSSLALPTASFDRFVFNPELWNTSLNQRYKGPAPQRIWRQLNSGGVTSSSPGYWRRLGNNLLIYPAPTAGQTVQFEYISKLWCETSTGTGQSAFAADTDVPRIDGELFVLEMVWRFRKSRGFAQYAEDMETAEREKEKLASRDRGSGRVRPEGSSGGGPSDPVWSGHIDG